MTSELTQRPQWAIEQALELLRGAAVRVAASAFSPVRQDGTLRWTLVRNLILPDNTAAAGLPVYFEGRLVSHVRQIGLVYVELATVDAPDKSAEGVVLFRGHTAVIVQAPALVKLAYPFVVEKLPADTVNYWSDLQVSRAQFKLPL